MDVASHYDRLIEEGNDPFFDPPVLQEYMNKWDGEVFLDSLKLDGLKNVLEIGVGTGRLAVKVAPFCNRFTGIDVSSKTIERAKENLKSYSNLSLICDDFITHNFGERFDIIYSSLTFMHFEDKAQFIKKVNTLLNEGGRFCLSIDKNQNDCIDMGKWNLKVYPDTPENIILLVNESAMNIEAVFETEFAHISVCSK